MRKIVLTDDLAGPSSDGTIMIDSKEMLRFSKDEDFLVSSVIEFMNELPAQTINGRSIKEWFRFRDHSLWWFAHGRLWPKIDEHVRFIINFENMLDIIRPDVVEIRGFYDKTELIRQICKKKDIRLSIGFFSRTKIFLSMKGKVGRRLLLIGSDVIAKRKETKRISLAREAKHEETDSIRKGCIVYVSYETYRRRIYDFQDGKIRDGEHISQKILKQIKEKGIDLLCVDADLTIRGELRALKQRLVDKDEYWMPLETLVARKQVDKELQKWIAEIVHVLAKLFREQNFQHVFSYDGIDLWNVLSFRMELLLTDRSLPQRIRDIQAIKDTLVDLKPRTVFLVYERGATAMTFIIAANELGIKTIGMQHGMVHKGHPDYAVRDVRTASSTLGCPIPTRTIVFGEFYRKLLTEKFAYPSDSVIVVGNPVYEDADAYLERLDKKAILTRLGLDPLKKTILIATSMAQKLYGKPDYDVIMIETLVKSFANRSGMQVVIKLHPAEDGSVYRRILSESKAENFVVLNHPIEELFLVCDVFLAVATTTLLEAIILGRPVIVIQVSEKINRDVFSLVESGAAIGAKYEELAEKVLQVLNNNALTEELRAKGSEFAKQHFNLPNREINKKITDVLIDPDKTI